MLKKQDLYGKKITQFDCSIQNGEFVKTASVVSIYTPGNGQAPASGCDIIIHGSSTNSERIFELNPQLVLNETTLFAYSATTFPKVTLHGYCDQEQVDKLFEDFKERAKSLLNDHASKLQSLLEDINAIVK